MNKKIFLVIIFFIFFSMVLFSGSVGTAHNSPDKLIADIYIKHSIEQFEKDNYTDAYSLSDIALSFNSESSDAKLIHAISGKNSGLSDNPIGELSDSIILDNWGFYNETSARFYLSKYMYWKGDIDKAYLNLVPFKKNLLINPIFSEFFIRISLGVGRTDAAVKTAEALLEIDPFDNYAQLTLARYSPSWLEKSVKAIMQGDPSNLISKQVVQYLIRNSSDCTYLRNYYLNKWGVDRFYNISNLCNHKDKLIDNLILLYPESSIVNYNELLWLNSLFDSEKNKQIVILRLNAINMTVEYDTDNDGFYDTEALFNNGKIVTFSIDENNDNHKDYIVDVDILPVRLKQIKAKQVISYNYNKYPNLVSAMISNEEFITDYQLIPYELDLDIIYLPSNVLDGIPSILQNAVLPDNDLMSAFSTHKNVTNRKNNTMTEFKMIDLDESVERVINSEGIKILERHYKNSVLISASKDSDSDGVFDTIFKYEDGILQSIAFDENNNGVFEYIENFEEGSVRSWDFNEDGIIDSRERIQDGTLIREMSSKFDGVLDTIININSEIK